MIKYFFYYNKPVILHFIIEAGKTLPALCFYTIKPRKLKSHPFAAIAIFDQ
jgi:hypothetical protein